MRNKYEGEYEPDVLERFGVTVVISMILASFLFFVIGLVGAFW